VGKVLAWGLNNCGQLGINADYSNKEFKSSYIPKYCKGLGEIIITNIYAGYNSSFAINQNGRVFVWGSNKDGVLGIKGQDSYGEAS
jgi:alpha-tubulin suppressor-like RCC1 family protein